MLFRLLRTIGLLLTGAMAGFMGAAAVLRATIPSRGDETSDEIALVTIFDSLEMRSQALAFRGGSLLAWYSGVILDLREVTLAPGATLEIGAAFAGVDIRVPESWRIEASGSGPLAGIAPPPPASDDADAPTLVVRVSAFAAGVSIRR
jgi:hypothetical protein